MKKEHPLSPFYTELILNLLFFAIASCILVYVFAYSQALNQESQDQQNAALEIQTLVETAKATSVLPESAYYYTQDWQNCSKASAVFVITVQTETQNALTQLTFRAENLQTDDFIWTMTAAMKAGFYT